MPTILGANSVRDTGYDVANSCRFDSASSDRLNRTLGTPTNNYKWTYSFWVKRGILGSEDAITGAFSNSQNKSIILFRTDDQFEIMDLQGDSYVMQKKTNRKFRDTSAWYHFVISSDATLSSPETKIYVNGVEETSFATTNEYTQNQANLWNSAIVNHIGASDTTSRFWDGYLTEFVFIDGQVLDPDSFGEFDEDSPTIWKPKDVSGLTFGNNGFYLDFEDASNLGNDANGGTDWTENNIAAVNQHTDTCTNNFATFNGTLGYNSTIVLAEGNIKGTTGSTHEALYGSIFSSIGVTQGKWYAEFKVTTNSDKSIIGISADLENDADGSSGSAFNFIYLGQGIGYYGNNGKIFHTNSNTQMTYGSSLSNNDIVGIALDVDNQEVYFSINGTFQNSGDPTSGSSKTGGVVNEGARNIFSTGTGTIFFAVADFDRDATCAIEANFGGGSVSAISSGNSDANGHGNFEYSVPSGYFALCTKNLAESG